MFKQKENETSLLRGARSHSATPNCEDPRELSCDGGVWERRLMWVTEFLLIGISGGPWYCNFSLPLSSLTSRTA